MKIAHIITRLILGGAQENTLLTCEVLARRGHDVTLITGPATGPEGELFDQARGGGYRIETVPHMIRAIHPYHDVLAYRHVKRLLRQIQPDIVHTHSAKAGILGRLAAYSLKNVWAPGRPAVVHTLHGLAFHPYQSQWLNRFYIAVERAATRRTDFFISVADAMTAQSLAAGIGRAEQYTTAYSAMDEAAFMTPIPQSQRDAFRDKYSIPHDSVVLVTIARLFMLKGHDYIIESARTLAPRHPNALWLFVGDGNLSDVYKQQVKTLGLADRFRFTGLLPTTAIPLAVQSSDILVHCSLREGLARALPQAMLAARPAISFDVDGAREVVNDNTGRLIPPKDTGRLIAACSELIADESLRTRLGRQAQAAVKTQFSPDTMVDAIEKVCHSLLA